MHLFNLLDPALIVPLSLSLYHRIEHTGTVNCTINYISLSTIAVALRLLSTTCIRHLYTCIRTKTQEYNKNYIPNLQRYKLICSWVLSYYCTVCSFITIKILLFRSMQWIQKHFILIFRIYFRAFCTFINFVLSMSEDRKATMIELLHSTKEFTLQNSHFTKLK